MKTNAKSATTLAGTIVTAILASSYCIWRPLILAALGIGSIGIFSFLERYRPLFMVVTFLFIGMAYCFTYRRKKAEDVCCEAKSDRIKKVSLWVITVTAVGLLFFGAFHKTPIAT